MVDTFLFLFFLVLRGYERIIVSWYIDDKLYFLFVEMGFVSKSLDTVRFAQKKLYCDTCTLLNVNSSGK